MSSDEAHSCYRHFWCTLNSRSTNLSNILNFWTVAMNQYGRKLFLNAQITQTHPTPSQTYTGYSCGTNMEVEMIVEQNGYLWTLKTSLKKLTFLTGQLDRFLMGMSPLLAPVLRCAWFWICAHFISWNPDYGCMRADLCQNPGFFFFLCQCTPACKHEIIHDNAVLKKSEDFIFQNQQTVEGNIWRKQNNVHCKQATLAQHWIVETSLKSSFDMVHLQKRHNLANA